MKLSKKKLRVKFFDRFVFFLFIEGLKMTSTFDHDLLSDDWPCIFDVFEHLTSNNFDLDMSRGCMPRVITDTFLTFFKI